MGLLSDVKNYVGRLDESIAAFKNKGGTAITPRMAKSMSGEGVEFSPQFSAMSTSSFNMFYAHYINKTFDNERAKILNYRNIAEMPEIADVIEDACIEATQEDLEGKILVLDIQEEDLKKNKNIIDKLQEEFDDLFYNKLKLQENCYDYFRSYFIDGRFYYERIIDEKNPKNGIIGIKKLPAETMDFEYDHMTGKIKKFMQYLNPDSGKRVSPSDKDVIEFDPAQIGFVEYGIYGRLKSEIFGYLEKVKVPYNTLKLLETSIIIYRIVRAPERLVIKIDVGNMPRDKAMKYVEKVKSSMMKKQSYDPSTGRLTQNPDVLSIMDNFFMSTCIDLKTSIPLLNGKEKPLYEIIEDFNNGIANEVYSIDQKTGKPIRGKINWAGVTRTDTEGVRVWLDNDEYLDCTPDHKFVMRDGSEKEAQYLCEQDSLMPLYLRQTALSKKKKNEYFQVFDLSTKKWKFVHSLFGPQNKLNNEVTHHIDYNRLNNMEDNLINMDSKEHIRYHCSLNSNKPEHIKKSIAKKNKIAMHEFYYGENGIENREIVSNRAQEFWSSEEGENAKIEMSKNKLEYFETEEGMVTKNLMSKSAKIRWSDPENRKQWYERIKLIREENKEQILENKKASHKRFYESDMGKLWGLDHSRKMTQIIDDTCGHLVVEQIIKENFPNYVKLVKLMRSNSKFIKYWTSINSNKPKLTSNVIGKNVPIKIINRIFGYNKYRDFLQNITINHKVVKVEKLPYRIDTGCLTIEDPGDNHNFAICAGVFIKNSSEGRGSDISSVGGASTAGFTELSDIKYFQRKLYQALKYPMSRVSAMQSDRESEVLFSRSPAGEISRDEIKWATFLSRSQNRFCNEWLNLFLLHLEFKGLKAEYELTRDNISIKMIQPSFYKDKQEQTMREVKFNNYLTLSGQLEFGKSFLMRKYLDWDENDLKANAESLKEDIKLGFRPDPKLEQQGGGY